MGKGEAGEGGTGRRQGVKDLKQGWGKAGEGGRGGKRQGAKDLNSL